MALNTGLFSGDLFLFKAGGSPVGFETQANLSVGPTIISTESKASGGFVTSVQSRVEWQISQEGQFVDGGLAVAGTGIGMTVGGAALKGITQIDASLALNFAETANTTTGLFLTRVPTTKQLSLSVQFDYYDPDYGNSGANNAGLYAVLQEARGAASAGLTVVVTIAPGTTLTGTFRPGQVDVAQSPASGFVTGTIPLESTGPFTIVDASTVDSGIRSLIAAYENEAAVSALMQLTTDGTTGDAGNTEFVGQAFVSGLDVSMDYDGLVTYTATLLGTGALTPQETS